MKILIIAIVAISIGMSFAQEYYIPLNVKLAYEKGTRSMDGNPGENYWQNFADYKIKIKLDPYNKSIEGTETIIYYNNSPDSLDEIVIRLYQNLYRGYSARNYLITPGALTEGVDIKRFILNNIAVDLNNKSHVAFTSTNLIIKLTEKIKPKSIIDLAVEWSFTIPSGQPLRMGIYDSTTFFIAYWYPQIAVYDDIDGWDKIDYNGEQEMYNDFNNFDVEIEVPDRFVIWSTGVLQNAKDILSESVYNKFEMAKNSDTVVKIISKDDYQTLRQYLSGKEKNIWQYKAEKVTDFAFGCSDHYLWDAVSMVLDRSSNRKVVISAAYNPEAADFYDVAKIAKNALEYFSTDMPGVPFPYPFLTVFNGGPGGMEFPMILNDRSQLTLAETVGLTSHEAAHTYFPFYMGINEQKYAWMDEGMAVMLPFDFQLRVEGNDPIRKNVLEYASFAGNEMEMPLMIPSILLRGRSYRVASYQKAGLAYQYLQDFLGREKFRRAMQEYIHRWNGKHPIPYDFFSSFENYLSKDLSWYFKPWFFERGYPDLAIKSYSQKNNSLEVEVEKVGNIPIPVKISLMKDGKKFKEIYRDADVWKEGNTSIKIQIEVPEEFDRILLGDMRIPDVNRKNNEVVIPK
jgi:hypothetical protein